MRALVVTAGIHVSSRVRIFVNDLERKGQADGRVRSSFCVCCLQSVNGRVSGRAKFRGVSILEACIHVSFSGRHRLKVASALKYITSRLASRIRLHLGGAMMDHIHLIENVTFHR